MTPQTFSLEMCRHLSSLVPEFEGHYEYVPYLIAGTVEDLLRYEVRCKNEPREVLPSPYYDDVKAFPAWQVEDLFRNWMKIIIALPNEKCNGFCSVCEKQGCRSVACRFYGLKAPQIPFGSFVTARIIDMLALDGDTAYQKIEEYLWAVLK